MKRTTATGHVDNQYIDRVGATAGTLIVASDKNMIQEELANGVEGVLPLDSAVNYQLSLILQSILLSQWTVSATGFVSTWSDIAFGDGVFVACGDSTPDPFMRSIGNPDASGWSEVAHTTGDWECIGFGNSIFIAGGDGLGCRSLNLGVSWADVSDSDLTGHIWTCVGYDGTGVWIMGSTDGRIVRSTDDGVTWTTVDTTGTTLFKSVDYDPVADVWMIGGITTAGLRRSTDGGLTWSTITVPAEISARGVHALVHCEDSTWVAHGVYSTAGSAGRVIRSTDDGATWANVSSNVDFYGNGAGIVYTGKLVVFLTVASIYTSMDKGANWRKASVATGGVNPPKGLTFGEGMWVLTTTATDDVTTSLHMPVQLG